MSEDPEAGVKPHRPLLLGAAIAFCVAIAIVIFFAVNARSSETSLKPLQPERKTQR